MKLVEIIDSETYSNIPVKMTEDDLDRLISKNGLNKVLSEYEIPESYILKREFDKDIILSHIHPSEEFLKEAIDIEYLTPNDLKLISTKSISNLSENFIKKYEECFDWNRMMNYLMASDKIPDIEDYEMIIEKNDLWKMISSSDLPTSFIRKHKDKLDWQYLAICKEFSEEDREEFKSYIEEALDKGGKMSSTLIDSSNSWMFSENIESEIVQASKSFEEIPQIDPPLLQTEKENEHTSSSFIPTRMQLITSLVKGLTQEEKEELKSLI